MKKKCYSLISMIKPLWKTKLFRTMRATLFMTVFSIVQVFAVNTYSQSTRMSLNLENVSIKSVLKQIEDQSDYYFIYDATVVDVEKKISIESENKSIPEILDKIFAGSDVIYKINNRQIAITTNKINFTSQQPKSVSGNVTDDSGKPLPGVTVVVKGTTTGTITDFDGNYTIDKVPANATLVFSFVGMRTQEIEVGNQSVINITLAEEAIGIDEVVAVGYGTQKKVNLTGAVGNVQMDDLENRPLTNSSSALQGKIAGVYALQKSGKPGADDAVINIRGIGTLNNSAPLVLIDGFPGDMNDVSANDIKSISVLKDASSAAIYGNRAANGVILITTKRGSSGKVKVTYNGYFGVQQATELPNMLTSEQWTRLYNEASVNSGTIAKYTDEEIQKYASGKDPMFPNVDYFDAYYDKATIQSHRISMTGGSENLHYAFMVGYLDQDGILIGTDYKKFDFRSNFDAFFLDKDKLRLSARLSGNKGERNEPTDEFYTKRFGTIAPIWPLKNSEDQWVAVIGEHNYYGELKEGSVSKALRYNFNSQLEAEYKIIDDLSAQITYGFNVVTANTNSFHANVLLANLDGSTRYLASDLTERNDLNTQTMLTSLLKYEKTINKHDFKLLAGYSEEEFNWKWNSGSRSRYVNNNQRYLNLGDASTQQNNSGAYDLGLQSFFGRLNYIFANKYLFEANIRQDGSSRFGEGYKWGTFPSFSAGWILSDEDFLKSIEWMDFLKIRGSWGQLGNQNIDTYYASSDILETGMNYTLGGSLFSGVASNSLANKETTWETTEQTNIGLDFTFNRNFDITVDYFTKKTSDILVQIPIPITMGNLTSPFQNVGEVKNTGVELSGTYRKQFSNGLKMRTTFNLSHIKNEVLDLHGRSPIINGPTALVEGYAINSYYGYQVDGIYQIDDFTWQNNSDPSIAHANRNYVLKDGVVSVANFTATPGDIKYRDISGDGVVTMDKDRGVIGKQFPDIAYSLQVNLDWKQFDFGMYWQGVSGIESYLNWNIATATNVGDWWLDRWTPENPSVEMPKITLDGTRTGIYSEFYMDNASYLRLKNIELGYSFNKRTCSFIGINSLRLYGNIQNALTLTKFKGLDPERVMNESGTEAYPQTRIFTLGLNVNF
ncbi:TonB-dependent receptor [Sunxiuqinia indica]|uniref:TonB-dependent receptor n=1 Tax=Sunxiuqinia indica TaxID=2692584 RepID=UPI00135B1B13|nr:TonB-dependent receptor [Sunxiuqinia indica]